MFVFSLNNPKVILADNSIEVYLKNSVKPTNGIEVFCDSENQFFPSNLKNNMIFWFVITFLLDCASNFITIQIAALQTQLTYPDYVQIGEEHKKSYGNAM